MTTKIKIKPIAIGALAGAGVGFAASKMMGKKKMPFIIGGVVLGALAGYMVGKRGEKKSNASGPLVGTPKLFGPTRAMLTAGQEFCDDKGNTVPYNYYTNENGTFPSKICLKNRRK